MTAPNDDPLGFAKGACLGAALVLLVIVFALAVWRRFAAA